MAKYHEATEGEWIRPCMKGYNLACCDCGLTHKIDFKIVDGRVWFRVYRNNRATGQIRRHLCEGCVAANEYVKQCSNFKQKTHKDE